MRTLALLALLAALPPAARADERPVVLHVLLNPDSGGDQRLTDNARLTQVTNYTAGRRLMAVAGAQDFADQLKRLKDSGGRLRQLIIDAHGSPAYSQVLSAGNLSRFEGLQDLFAPGAEIWFTSCNTGKGDEGLAFMRAVGQTFLAKNGGRVTASIDYVRFLTPTQRALMGPVAMAQGEGSLKGYLQLRVQPGGQGTLYYLPPGGQEFLAQADTRLNQAVDLARFQVQTVEDVVRLQARLTADAARAAQRTAVQAAPVVRRTLPFVAPGLDLALRLFDGGR